LTAAAIRRKQNTGGMSADNDNLREAVQLTLGGVAAQPLPMLPRRIHSLEGGVCRVISRAKGYGREGGR